MAGPLPPPTPPSPIRVGTRRKNPDTGEMEIWNGTEWIPVPQQELEN